MRINDIKIPVLTHLFEKYKSGGGEGTFDITNLIKVAGFDPVEGSDYLNSWGWLKDRTFEPGGIVNTTISFSGIKEINRVWVKQLEDTVMAALGESGGVGELMQILGFEPKDAAIARDLALWMKTQELIDATFYGLETNVELTDWGRKFYQVNKRLFNK